jgi:hypothetical protein
MPLGIAGNLWKSEKSVISPSEASRHVDDARLD